LPWRARRRVQGEYRQRVLEATRHQHAMASSWRANVPWRANYLRGELRQPNPSKLTWQRPTRKESSTHNGEQITCHDEFIKVCISIKALSSFQKYIMIPYATLRREKTGKTRETLKEQGA